MVHHCNNKMRFPSKYTWFALLNFIVLSVLFFAGLDEIDWAIGLYIGHEAFHAFVYVCAWLVATIILRIMFRKRVNGFTKGQKWQHLVILFVVASGYLHMRYAYHLIQRKTDINRVGLLNKWEPSPSYPLGARADSLTYGEYLVLEKQMWFPHISEKSKNISFSYYYDGFLPDYSLRISYDVPLSVAVSSFNHDRGQNEKNQSVEVKDGWQHVDYTEGRR